MKLIHTIARNDIVKQNWQVFNIYNAKNIHWKLYVKDLIEQGQIDPMFFLHRLEYSLY